MIMKSESSDNMSTPTPTPKARPAMRKTYAFTASSSNPSSYFTYTTNSKTAEKLPKIISNNTKKHKIAETSEKPKPKSQNSKSSTTQAEMLSSDTEEESLTALHNAAKRVLQKVLCRVETEEKGEVKQALYYLKKVLKQVKVESPLEIQLKQLNTKMNLLLRKQDSTITTTQKIAGKAVNLAQKQGTFATASESVQKQTTFAAAEPGPGQKQNTKPNLT